MLQLNMFTTGRVSFSSLIGDKPDHVKFELRTPGAADVVAEFEANLTAVGSFWTIAPGKGSDDLSLKASVCIRKTVRIDITSGSVQNAAMRLTNSEIDGDNAIMLFDYIVPSDALDSSPGDPSWVAGADLDRVDAVMVLDYGILSDSFDKSGD